MDILVKVLLASVPGAFIGFEREMHGRPDRSDAGRNKFLWQNPVNLV